jgi:hypothetical protein
VACCCGIISTALPLFAASDPIAFPTWNEASELIVRDHVPEAKQREAVHEAVRTLVAKGVPKRFRLMLRHPFTYAVEAPATRSSALPPTDES